MIAVRIRMNRFHPAVPSCLAVILPGVLSAQEPAEESPQVQVAVSGVETGTIGPGAPPHVVGLARHHQTISMDTGVRKYALRYGVARDPKDPKAAIPGEGYIGMTAPSNQNWYGGGFFDIRLNGKSIGTTMIRSLTGRSSGDRGTADFVFDASDAVVRVRFVAKAGGDCVYAQVLFEPKQKITSVQVLTRCYPSAFVTDGRRHVQTATRDFAQGNRAALDIANEWWTLYYDRIYDAGYIGPAHRGVGPCAMLWVPGQTEKAGFTVGGYGIDTVLDLKPTLRDFRFVFFDYAGRKNEEAKADLRSRAPALLQELATFAFTDPRLANWPLPQKREEIQQALASLPGDEAAARYQRWAEELAAQLKLLRSDSVGAIAAEVDAAQTIDEWERGLSALKLKALLNKI